MLMLVAFNLILDATPADDTKEAFNASKVFNSVGDKESDTKRGALKACEDYASQYDLSALLTRIEVPTSQTIRKDYRICESKFQRINVYQGRYTCDVSCQSFQAKEGYQCEAKLIVRKEKALPSRWHLLWTTCPGA